MLRERVTGPQGEFNVSTVRTPAGGRPDERRIGVPFALSDYADDNPWPFETMVFRPGSSRGLYHEPHKSEQQARDGHVYAVSLIRSGTFVEGHGVRGEYGNPSITAEEWHDRMSSTSVESSVEPSTR